MEELNKIIVEQAKQIRELTLENIRLQKDVAFNGTIQFALTEQIRYLNNEISDLRYKNNG